MIWFVALLVCVVLAARDLYEADWPTLGGERNFLDWCIYLATVAFVGALLAIPIIGFGCIIGSQQPRIGNLEHTYPLVALRQQDGFSGHSYFLGAGEIEDRQYYFWYRRNADGTVSGGKTVRDPCSSITLDASAAPAMSTYQTAYLRPEVSWVWNLFGIDARSNADWCPAFTIPPGSIKEGFSL